MIGLILLAAHLVGDFWLQSNNMALNKFTDWKVRTLHVLVYTACFIPVMVIFNIIGYAGLVDAALFLALLFVAHWITDTRRWTSSEWAPKPIIVDQTLHVIQLALFSSICFGI